MVLRALRHPCPQFHFSSSGPQRDCTSQPPLQVVVAMGLKSEQCHMSENYVPHLQVQPNKHLPVNTPPYTFFLAAVRNGDDPKAIMEATCSKWNTFTQPDCLELYGEVSSKASVQNRAI